MKTALKTLVDLGRSRELRLHWDTQDAFHHFLGYLQLLLCGRCYRDAWKTIDFPKHGHSYGVAIAILSDSPAFRQGANKWFMNDLEHGLFHGICTAFMAYLSEYQEYQQPYTLESFGTNIPDMSVGARERMLMSCLLHDYGRAFDTRNHDWILAHSFPALEPVTFRHREPTPQDELHPLVIGDRLELQRFKDWESWVDQSKLRYPLGERRLVMEHFYSHLRPTLARLYEFRDKRWLRHGVERPGVYNFEDHKEYPQEGGYWAAALPDSGRDAPWACEFAHLQDACILNHPKNRMWLRCFGLLPHWTYKFRSELRPCYYPHPPDRYGLGPTRDHLAASGYWELDEWVFGTEGLERPPRDESELHPKTEQILTLNDQKQHPANIADMLALDVREVHNVIRQDQSRKHYEFVRQLLQAGSGVLELQTIQTFLRIVSQVENLLAAFSR